MLAAFDARLNAAAQMYGWPVRLEWSGFRGTAGASINDPLPVDAEQALVATLRNLLRRFVSAKWLAVRGMPALTAADDA